MTKGLHISDDLTLPLEFVTSTQAILAKKRVGKTYTASVEAEELLKLDHQMCAIDPTGAWYGLKSSADGKHPGFKIVVFGGEHADVPLEESAGEIIANALVEQKFSAIIDLSLFRKAAMNRFMADFLEVLYHKNREAMHLFVDEADLFAPQKPFKGQERTLGAMEDVVRRGGIRGIGCTLITQRSSVINKDVLTQVGLLTVMRLSHPRDIDPIREWVGVHGEEAQYKEMRESLPSLERGTAWVWAPEWELFKKVAIRERETFDSGATPKVGQVKRLPKVVAEIDIQALGERIKATVEKAKADDPRALRAEIARLQREMKQRPDGQKTIEKIVRVPDPDAVKLALYERDQEWITTVTEFRKKSTETLDKMVFTVPRSKAPKIKGTSSSMVDDKFNKPVAISRLMTESKIARAVKMVNSNGNGDLSGPEQRILDAIAWMESIGVSAPKQTAVAFLAGYTFGGGGFNNPRGALRTKGLLEYRGDALALTEGGRAKSHAPSMPLDSSELHSRVLNQLPGPERKILQCALEVYPEAITDADLAKASGYTHGGGGYNNPRGRLRTLNLVEYPERGMVRAADLLFID
jgi:hypothetical protein